MNTLFIFYLIALIVFNIATIADIITLIYIAKLLKEDRKKEAKGNSKVKNRRKAIVKTSNYNNSFNTRGYDRYKNKDGLYEPQKPHQGIELKAKKEE